MIILYQVKMTDNQAMINQHLSNLTLPVVIFDLATSAYFVINYFRAFPTG